MPIVLGDFETSACGSMDSQSRPPQIPPQNQTPPQNRPDVPQMLGSGQEPEIEENSRPPQMPNQQPMVAGMAYVPWQRWQQPYDYEEGFRTGTIFPELNLPFLAYQGGRRR